MEKQMAIMKNVGYGCRDVDSPILFFDVYISEGVAALQILGGIDAENFIKAYHPYDIKDLEGKPVWVIVEGNKVTLSGPCKIK